MLDIEIRSLLDRIGLVEGRIDSLKNSERLGGIDSLKTQRQKLRTLVN
jgi:hypothetical protein